MESFQSLVAWQKGMLLLKEVHSIIKKLPAEERFEMASQMRRASKSILANIAEGFGKKNSPDKAGRYTIARGECSETTAFLLMCVALNYCSELEAKPSLELAEETGKLLSGLIKVHAQKP